jgi:hypothetical protein
MLLRLFRRDADRLLDQALNRYRVEGRVANSQLSRWRNVIYSALNETSPVRRIGRVTQFMIAEEEKGGGGWDSLRRVRVDGGGKDKQRLTDWIRDVLSQTDFPWQLLTGSQQPLRRSLANYEEGPNYVSASPSYEMALEYRLRLVDGVLAMAAKRED